MLTVLTVLLVTIEIICSLLLIGVILIQKTKSQGMGLAFGSGMGENLFGAQVGNVLTRVTVIVGIIFLINTTALAIVGAKRGARSVADSISEAPVPVSMPAATELPQMPAPMESAGVMDQGAVDVPIAVDSDMGETVAE